MDVPSPSVEPTKPRLLWRDVPLSKREWPSWIATLIIWPVGVVALWMGDKFYKKNNLAVLVTRKRKLAATFALLVVSIVVWGIVSDMTETKAGDSGSAARPNTPATGDVAGLSDYRDELVNWSNTCKGVFKQEFGLGSPDAAENWQSRWNSLMFQINDCNEKSESLHQKLISVNSACANVAGSTPGLMRETLDSYNSYVAIERLLTPESAGEYNAQAEIIFRAQVDRVNRWLRQIDKRGLSPDGDDK